MNAIACASSIVMLSVALTGCNRSPQRDGTPEQVPAATTKFNRTVAEPRAYSDQDISDAWIYLLGRLLVLRQQNADLAGGMKWNEITHRKPGAVDWPNPNLDVAYSEAWVAVDEDSCTVVTVPKITGRYYTVQFLNGWGETVANINERTQPAHPFGEFAICLAGARAALPPNVTRIDVPVKHMRMLSRVELGDKWSQAVALQHQFDLRATGAPVPPTLPAIAPFDQQHLPGADAFENVAQVLDSERDINPGMEAVASKARAIGNGIEDPTERARVDRVVRDRAHHDLARASPTIGHGTLGNGWARPAVAGTYGEDWLGRTLVNLGGIWANRMDEVVYYKGNLDSTRTQLNGDNSYAMTFPKDALPPKYATYFWSVIAVDPVFARVLPNPESRFLLNRESRLKYNADGSLTLYFAPDRPVDAPDQNWLPTPKGQDYRLTLRFYGPRLGVADGIYYPPALIKLPASN